MAITPDVSRQWLGTQGLVAQALYLSLFSDDETLGAATVAGSLTEVTGGGFAYKTIAGTMWSASSASGTSTMVLGGANATQTWTFTGSVGNVYGYSICDGTGITGNLVAAEKFATAQMVSANGDKISIVPTIKLV